MSGQDVLIRPASPRDVPQIGLLIEPFVEERKLLPRTYEELTDLTRNGFVAEFDGRVVGFASVDVYSRKLAEVVCLAVSRGWQQQGVGKRLVRQCVRRSRELGVLELMAISAADGFLRECGFDYCLPNEKKALFYQPQTDHGDEDD